MSSRIAPVLLLATLVPLAGCSKGPKDRLQGRWIGDRIENVPAEALARATGWVKGTELHFAGDKVTVTIPAEQPRTGTFRVAKVDGNHLSLDVAREGGQTDPAELVMTEDNKLLRWQIGEGREIVLARVQ